MCTIFTDDEIINMCQEIIDSVKITSEETYNLSVIALNELLKVAGSEFQKACIHAAYYKLWEPETKTLFCLFE